MLLRRHIFSRRSPRRTGHAVRRLDQGIRFPQRLRRFRGGGTPSLHVQAFQQAARALLLASQKAAKFQQQLAALKRMPYDQQDRHLRQRLMEDLASVAFWIDQQHTKLDTYCNEIMTKTIRGEQGAPEHIRSQAIKASGDRNELTDRTFQYRRLSDAGPIYLADASNPFHCILDRSILTEDRSYESIPTESTTPRAWISSSWTQSSEVTHSLVEPPSDKDAGGRLFIQSPTSMWSHVPPSCMPKPSRLPEGNDFRYRVGKQSFQLPPTPAPRSVKSPRFTTSEPSSGVGRRSLVFTCSESTSTLVAPCEGYEMAASRSPGTRSSVCLRKSFLGEFAYSSTKTSSATGPSRDDNDDEDDGDNLDILSRPLGTLPATKRSLAFTGSASRGTLSPPKGNKRFPGTPLTTRTKSFTFTGSASTSTFASPSYDSFCGRGNLEPLRTPVGTSVRPIVNPVNEMPSKSLQKKASFPKGTKKNQSEGNTLVQAFGKTKKSVEAHLARVKSRENASKPTAVLSKSIKDPQVAKKSREFQKIKKPTDQPQPTVLEVQGTSKALTPKKTTDQSLEVSVSKATASITPRPTSSPFKLRADTSVKVYEFTELPFDSVPSIEITQQTESTPGGTRSVRTTDLWPPKASDRQRSLSDKNTDQIPTEFGDVDISEVANRALRVFSRILDYYDTIMNSSKGPADQFLLKKQSYDEDQS